MLKKMDLCRRLGEIYLTNMEDNYWTLAQKTGLDALETDTKKVVHKAA